MKTLAYFASGINNPGRFESLDFADIIYLIDHRFDGTYYKSNKVICLGMNALESIDYFIQNNIKLDYFVSVNDGLFEGGGTYAIQSDIFIGYAMQVLKDEYIHVINWDYYNYYINHYRKEGLLDLPYDKSEITKGDKEYFDTSIFSNNYPNSAIYKNTFTKTETQYKINNRVITITNDSIWKYVEQLDLILVPFNKMEWRSFFYSNEKVNKMNAMKKLIIDCNEKKIEKIGILPWRKGEYKYIYEILNEDKHEYPKEIGFYHLNRNDFFELK